jgi:hypothetical protein
MKVKILLIFILFICTSCYAQKDTSIKSNKDTLRFNPAKNKFSLGIGKVITKQNGSFSIYTVEFFKTFNDKMGLGAGLDIYGPVNQSNPGSSPSLNFYFFYNPYILINKNKIAEFYLGPGIEVGYTTIQALALVRVDFDISKDFSLGISLKQPLFYNDQESYLTYHILKFNLSINSF